MTFRNHSIHQILLCVTLWVFAITPSLLQTALGQERVKDQCFSRVVYYQDHLCLSHLDVVIKVADSVRPGLMNQNSWEWRAQVTLLHTEV
jgi:hypothetical protein